MAFGLGNNTAPPITTGFRTSTGFGGFNIGNGFRGAVGNFLRKEFSYNEIFSNLVQFQQTLSVFDWNKTDEELRQLYKTYQTQLAGQMGALVGRGIGSTLAVGLGGVAGITVPKISSGQLAKRLMQAASEDARDEIIGEVEGTIQSIKGMALNLGAIEVYINLRTFIKGLPRSVLESIYGKQTTDFIKNTWGEKDANTLILQEALEEKIESISNPQIRAFIEEATEEFFESIIETGFVIAGELDSAFREFQLTRVQNNNDQTQTVTLQTIADEPNSERFIISADNYEEAEDEIRQTLQQWRIMQNRDIGQIITQNVEILEQHPQQRRLEITFRTRPHPPWINDNGISKITTLTIPNFKQNITYEELKRNLKYSLITPSYIWGDDVAVLKFTDKRKIRIQYDHNQMQKDQIELLLKSFADLSDGIIKTITTNEVVQQPRALRDTGIGMYPVYCKVFAQNLTQSDIARANQLPRASYEFPLWLENEPDDFNQRINYVPPIQTL